MSRTIELTVKFTMDERTARLFMRSAIERVINTSVRLVETSNDEDADVNVEDWQEWKPVVVSMWGALNDAAFRALSNPPMNANDLPYVLRKGDL